MNQVAGGGSQVAGKAVDPICGMSVDPSKAPSATRDGVTYYFCGQGCKRTFEAQSAESAPATRDLRPATSSSPATRDLPPATLSSPATRDLPPATSYTCPMHPEVISDKPGTCPICGMALEPRTATLEDQPNEELIDMQRRLIVATILTIPLLIGGMSMRLGAIAQFLLATPVVIWCGAPFFARGFTSIVTRRLNMFTLIALGTGAAYAFSVVATFIARGLPLYYEPAAVITTLVLVGQVLELRARERTSHAIKALLRLTPKTAHVIDDDGGERDVDVDAIKPGMRIRIRPGERIAVDGVVVEGTCSIDESTITGEPLPVEKGKGSKVTAGTVNVNGAIIMRAERVGADTLLAQIVRMVSEAQRSRAPIQRLADVVSAWFVPAVIAIAVITFAAWMTVGLSQALVNAVAVVIIACPCALGLATPMSVMVATGRGAHAGILVHDAQALEAFAKVDVVVVDKTGTLTEGKPKVVAIESDDEREALRLAASLERASEHPLANAIVSAAVERGIELTNATNIETTPGRGIRGIVDGKRVSIGNARFEHVAPPPSAATSDAAGRGESAAGGGGAASVFVTIDGKPAARIVVEDPIKTTTPDALRALHAKGIRVVMVTGDSRATGEKVAKDLGIDELETEVLPAEKEAIVRRLQSEGHRVAMAGDGVNDAPALSRADVGIAMGTGTDIAIESAGITLVKGDLRGIVRARTLSEAMMRNIKQNLFFAFFYNILGVPIAAGVLYPFFGLLLSPIIASAAMTFSSVTVIANALRLRRVAL
jgi:Cu+-exporting ATPase